jgi:hypothetical protein
MSDAIDCLKKQEETIRLLTDKCIEKDNQNKTLLAALRIYADQDSWRDSGINPYHTLADRFVGNGVYGYQPAQNAIAEIEGKK